MCLHERLWWSSIIGALHLQSLGDSAYMRAHVAAGNLASPVQHLCRVPCGAAESRLAKIILLDLLRAARRAISVAPGAGTVLDRANADAAHRSQAVVPWQASLGPVSQPQAWGPTEYQDLTAAASPCQLLLRYRFSPNRWSPLCLNTQRAAQLCAKAAAWQPRGTVRHIYCHDAVTQNMHRAAQLCSTAMPGAWDLGEQVCLLG